MDLSTLEVILQDQDWSFEFISFSAVFEFKAESFGASWNFVESRFNTY